MTGRLGVWLAVIGGGGASRGGIGGALACRRGRRRSRDVGVPGALSGAAELFLRASVLPPGLHEILHCRQPAGFHRLPWNEGVGVDFQPRDRPATGTGAEDFQQEFDFPENRPIGEFLRFGAVNE